MKRILVLGAGPSQLDLVVKAKEMGMEVYGCGKSGNEEVLSQFDGFKQIDICDEDAVEEYAREVHADFLFTMGLEIALPIITNVSTKLGLPNFFSQESLAKLKNKACWREVLGDIDGNLKFKSGSCIEDFEDWNTFPAVLKPADGSGQRGVHRVESFEDIKEVFDLSISYSRSHTLILEEFADGEEISVNSFMYSNKLAAYIPSDRISYTEYPGGIIKEHHIPSKLSVGDCDDRVRKLVETVNQKMGFENGHVYFQIKIKDGRPQLIEFTPRFDGCHMWRLVMYATGLDLRQCSLEWLATGHVEEFDNGFECVVKPGSFKTKFISDKPGTVVDKKNYDLDGNRIYTQWYYNDGDKVKSVTGYLEKVGFVMVKNDGTN